MLLGLGPPQFNHGGQTLGLGGGEVVALGTVHLDVVELPRVVVEAGAGLVTGHGLPPFGVDGAVTGHLEVLHQLVRGLVGIREGVLQRRTRDGHLLVAAVRFGNLNTQHVVDRRSDVGDVVELVT